MRRIPDTRTSLCPLHSQGRNTHSRTLGSRWASARRSVGIPEGDSANTLGARLALHLHSHSLRNTGLKDGGYGPGVDWVPRGAWGDPLPAHSSGASGRQREVVRPGITRWGRRQSRERERERARGKTQSQRKRKAGESSRERGKDIVWCYLNKSNSSSNNTPGRPRRACRSFPSGSPGGRWNREYPAS